MVFGGMHKIHFLGANVQFDVSKRYGIPFISSRIVQSSVIGVYRPLGLYHQQQLLCPHSIQLYEEKHITPNLTNFVSATNIIMLKVCITKWHCVQINLHSILLRAHLAVAKCVRLHVPCISAGLSVRGLPISMCFVYSLVFVEVAGTLLISWCIDYSLIYRKVFETSSIVWCLAKTSLF